MPESKKYNFIKGDEAFYKQQFGDMPSNDYITNEEMPSWKAAYNADKRKTDNYNNPEWFNSHVRIIEGIPYEVENVNEIRDKYNKAALKNRLASSDSKTAMFEMDNTSEDDQAVNIFKNKVIEFSYLAGDVGVQKALEEYPEFSELFKTPQGFSDIIKKYNVSGVNNLNENDWNTKQPVSVPVQPIQQPQTRPQIQDTPIILPKQPDIRPQQPTVNTYTQNIQDQRSFESNIIKQPINLKNNNSEQDFNGYSSLNPYLQSKQLSQQTKTIPTSVQNILNKIPITQDKANQPQINTQTVETKEPENPFPNMSPEELAIYNSLDENKPIFEQLYRRTVEKPKQISEKGMKAAQTASHIGNSLGILAEMFGASQGARISPRQSNLVENQIATERAIRAQNEAENNQYNSGLLNAQFNDSQQKAQNEAQKRAFMANLIRQKKADELAQKKLTAQAEKEKKDDDYKAKLLKLRERDLNIKQSKGNKTADEKEGKFTGIVINARPDDNKAVTDPTGNKVIRYPLNKSEINNIANRAKQDDVFKTKYDKVVNIDRYDPLMREFVKGFADDETLANIYLQYLYDQTAPKQQPNEDWKMYLPGGDKSAVQPKNDPLGLGL